MNYIYKLFDEFSAAEEILKLGEFPDGGTNREMKVLTKYFRKQIADDLDMDLEQINREHSLMKEVSEAVEKKLIDFCNTAIPSFNYYEKCLDINYAIRLSEKYRANTAIPLPITELEWETIQSLDDENAKKILFIRLIDAKYTATNRKTIGRYEYNDEEFFNRDGFTKEMCCREMNISRNNYDKGEKVLVKEGLLEHKYIHDNEGVKCVGMIMCVDMEGEDVIDYITDYQNILLHYERLCGGNIGTCKECGRLFIQSDSRNKYKYCEKHRTTNKTSEKKKRVKLYTKPPEEDFLYRHCFVCNSVFELPKRGNTSNMVLCKKCQERRNKEKRVDWMKNKRENAKTSEK